MFEKIDLIGGGTWTLEVEVTSQRVALPAVLAVGLTFSLFVSLALLYALTER